MLGLAIAGAGNLTTKTMNQTTLTQSQRKDLVDMLNQHGYMNNSVWCRAKEKYEETRSSLTRSLIADYVKSGKLSHLVWDYRALKLKLLAVGVFPDEAGEVTYANNAAGRDLRKVHEEKADKKLGTIDEVLTLPFEMARIRLLTVSTAEEAQKVLEPLVKFEVTVK
jgi:hypothetical protein